MAQLHFFLRTSKLGQGTYLTPWPLITTSFKLGQHHFSPSEVKYRYSACPPRERPMTSNPAGLQRAQTMTDIALVPLERDDEFLDDYSQITPPVRRASAASQASRRFCSWENRRAAILISFRLPTSVGRGLFGW